MKKLSALGIGPKIGRVAIPYLLITVFLSIYFKETFIISPAAGRTLFIAGVVLMAIGLIFYAVTVRLLLQGLKQTKLITSWTYYLCQHPLYASMILMLVPSIALLLNSWLVFTASPVTYLLYRHYISSEYTEMESFFGQAYLDYKKKTPALFPLPVKKWRAK
jgi:protein-S-isoprenylcysteine O-methyltransferase Ste14